MESCAPKVITIVPDDYYTRDVGRTPGGSRFFLTTPFVPKMGKNPGREFLALYLFDATGRLESARIEDLGTRSGLDQDAARELRAQWLAELGHVRRCPIKAQPFQVERFGVVFGLVPRPPEDEDDEWWVIVEPGDYIAFTPPWDGSYDT
ncbi:MAG: hypothetical protein ACO1SX_25790 [Actinomycetota bacterium]